MSKEEPMPGIASRLGLAAALIAVAATLAACDEKPTQDIQGAINETLRQTGGQAGEQGNWAEAVVNFRALLQRNPTDPSASLGLVRALRNVGQPDEAVRFGAAAVAQHPQDAKLLAEYA